MDNQHLEITMSGKTTGKLEKWPLVLSALAAYFWFGDILFSDGKTNGATIGCANLDARFRTRRCGFKRRRARSYRRRSASRFIGGKRHSAGQQAAGVLLYDATGGERSGM